MNRTRLVLAGLGVCAAALVLYFVVRGRGDGERPGKDAPPVAAVEPKPVRATEPSRGPNGGFGGQLRVLIDDDPAGTLRLEGQVLGASDEPIAGAVVSVDANPTRQIKTEQDGSFFIDKLVGRTYTLVARAPQGIAGPLTAQLNATSDPVILKLRPGSAAEVTVVDAKTKQPIAGATVEVRGIDTVTGTTDDDGVARIKPVVPGPCALAAYAAGYAKQHGALAVPGDEATATARLELRRGAAVSGRVVDSSGSPVESASVRYQGASEWSTSADPRRDAVDTDREGRFKFDALPAGTFRFAASSPNLAPGASAMVTLDGASEKTGVEIRLDPGATLRGTVVGKAGEPAGAARIRVRVRTDSMSFDEARQAWASDAGKFEITGLPRRPLEVLAAQETASSDLVEVDMSTPPAEREITLTLALDGTIAGVVVDTRGEPIEGAQVSAMPDFGGAAGREKMSTFFLRGVPERLTDAGGRFSIGGLEPGRFGLRASRSVTMVGLGRGWLTEPTMAETGQKDLRIVLPADGRVKGKVAFKDGNPPSMFQVGFSWQGGTPFSTKDGSFELTDLPPRTYNLQVSGPGFDSKSIPDVVVKEGEAVDIGTVVVAKGRTIAGRVVGSNGQPVADALVRAGGMLFGDGSSSKATFGGPPMARGKETRTDENGAFVIYGVGRGDLSIVAEHDVQGRSASLYVPGSTDSITGLEVALSAFGSLAGIVRKGGAPAPDVIVNAASVTAPSVMFGVSSGPDGKFTFDRLAPDTYKVSAMTGRNPMQGFGLHPKLVKVESEKTATVELSIEAGEVSLQVALTAAGGGQLNFGVVQIMAGPVTAKTARELNFAIGATEAFTANAYVLRGNPASLANLAPGAYTVCGVPYPPQVTGMSGVMEYMQREGDNLAVFCQPVQVAPAPAQQTVSIDVQVPVFVPPPEDSGG